MKKAACLFCSFILFALIGIPVFGYSYTAFSQSDTNSDYNLTRTIEELIDWKKSDAGAKEGESIFTAAFLAQAGATAGDWYPIGMGRYGYPENYQSYLAVLADNVSVRYGTENKLDKYKATEWHRIALAVAATGGNPRAVGEYDGAPIDLISDGTYNRGFTVSPGRQGINGWIWGLIALDCKRYDVPEDACHQRQDFIREILRAQLADGGYALTGNLSDPDVTAMAVQALAPYYNSEIVYEYTSAKITEKDENGQELRGEQGGLVYKTMQKTVRQVIDECVEKLAQMQEEDGDYSSWGVQNVESACQVVVALTSLGIDPLSDQRFVTASGKTLLDGIMKYRLENGGFVHSFTYDPDNPTSLPDKANSMAGEQVLYALVALWRNQNAMRTLYDMRAEFGDGEKALIEDAKAAIGALSDNSEKVEVSAALEKYVAVDELDRCYVANYCNLSSLAKKYGLKLPEESLVFSGNQSEENGVITLFMPSDSEAVSALPAVEKLSTENYVEVVTLFEKLKNAENREDYKGEYITLEKAYNRIAEIQAEIDDIKTEIKKKLYPFDSISLSERSTVLELYNRYMALSEYDRSQFEVSDIEGLLKCKTQVDNLLTALIVGLGCCVAAAVTIVSVVLHIRMRRKKKAAEEMVESDE